MADGHLPPIRTGRAGRRRPADPEALVAAARDGDPRALARLVSLAANFLGDRKTAIDWLKRPNHALGGVAPLAIIDTELGARQVENVLGRIGYGGVS